MIDPASSPGSSTWPRDLDHLANEHLGLVDRDVEVAAQRGAVVDDVPLDDPIVAPVPRHANVVDRPAVDQEGPDATGDQACARIEARGVVMATQSRLGWSARGGAWRRTASSLSIVAPPSEAMVVQWLTRFSIGLPAASMPFQF